MNPFQGTTPLKINMEPKNGGLEDDFPFQTGDFQVPAINFPGSRFSPKKTFMKHKHLTHGFPFTPYWIEVNH